MSSLDFIVGVDPLPTSAGLTLVGTRHWLDVERSSRCSPEVWQNQPATDETVWWSGWTKAASSRRLTMRTVTQDPENGACGAQTPDNADAVPVSP